MSFCDRCKKGMVTSHSRVRFGDKVHYFCQECAACLLKDYIRWEKKLPRKLTEIFGEK